MIGWCCCFMDKTSLIIISLFYVSLFLKAALLRRKGITVNLMLKQEGKTKETIKADFFVTFGSYGSGFVQFISSLFYEKLPKMYLSENLYKVGIVLSLIGTLFFIVSMINMRDSWRQGVSLKQRTDLITTGIYKYSRNPAFSGIYLFYIGVFLMIPTYICLIFLLVSIPAFHFQILSEEKNLSMMFGAKYKEYYNATPRYFLIF